MKLAIFVNIVCIFIYARVIYFLENMPSDQIDGHNKKWLIILMKFAISNIVFIIFEIIAFGSSGSGGTRHKLISYALWLNFAFGVIIQCLFIYHVFRFLWNRYTGVTKLPPTGRWFEWELGVLYMQAIAYYQVLKGMI